MKQQYASIIIMSLGLMGHAGTLMANEGSFQKDSAYIAAQAGCYEVTYHFKEISRTDPNYPVRSPEYFTKGIEWIVEEKIGENEIALQHILTIPHGFIKHWSQNWTFQPNFVFQYDGNNQWSKQPLPADKRIGKWSQQVFQVDGGPRYGCVAEWTHQAQDHFWECKTWSPLPRRELSQRHDYNVLERNNRHQIYPNEWIHHQTNTKLRVDQGLKEAIATETGTDTYKRIDSSQCAAAKKWWSNARPIWNEIHSVWSEIYQLNDKIELKPTVNGKMLWEELFDFADIAMKNQISLEQLHAQTQSVIDQFIVR
jgi:hypothetical protein